MRRPFGASLIAFGTALLVGGCNDARSPIEPSPDMAISDAAHNEGNEHFYFLPPMVPAPSFTGVFDGEQEPIVEICVWNGSRCGVGLELYTTKTGPGSETIRVDVTEEEYVVNWRTRDILENVPLGEGETYRIRVLIGMQVLGYADVEVVGSGRELRNVDTNEFIPLIEGQILPIRFRLEEGWEAAPTEIVSAGFQSSCAVVVTGDAYCWGNNSGGQLGIGYRGGILTSPQLVLGGHHFVSISNTIYHTCGVTTDGAAYCWGYNYFGQLGDGSRSWRFTPSLVAGGHTWSSVTTGYYHTCGVTTEGDAYCWGYNAHGQIGDGTVGYNFNPTPTMVSGGHSFQSISSEVHTNCGLTTAGTVYCWGDDYYGTTGQGTTFPSHGISYRPVPTPVVGLDFRSIDAGAYATCGVATDGAAYCWGFNRNGGLGIGTVSPSWPYAAPTPSAVVGALDFSAVNVGYLHTCGVTPDGAAYCWGHNYYGQLGTGERTLPPPYGVPSPVAVTGGHSFSMIDAGLYFTCGATTTADVRCWGYNQDGQLGNGSMVSSSEPVFSLDLDPTTP